MIYLEICGFNGLKITILFQQQRITFPRLINANLQRADILKLFHEVT